MSLLREAQRCLDNCAIHLDSKAFINIAQKGAVLAQAQDADRKPGQGAINGKLLAVKDNICTSDLPTTAASSILKTFTSPYDASVVSRLRRAGGIIIGKTNLDEFGMGSHSTHSHFGSVSQKNPLNPGRALSAGGSSGGSAVAVATDQCWASLGTDTGGSVRLPAAYAGVVGFKPSYGRISRWGVIAYANSLDTVGILAKSSQDARDMFEILDYYDPKDPTNLTPASRSRLKAHLKRLYKADRDPKIRSTALSKLRVGVPVEYNIEELNPQVRAAWLATLERLRDLGHSIQPVSLPTTRHALSAYYILAPAEASSNLAKYDGVRYGSRAPLPDGDPSSVLFAKTRGAGFGVEVKRRILLGAYSLSAEAIDNYFIQAQKIRRLVQHDFNSAFNSVNPLLTGDVMGDDKAAKDSQEFGGQDKPQHVEPTADGVDVLVCPTAPAPAPALEEAQKLDPVHAYINDVFTVPASLAGLPAVSVPAKVFSGHVEAPVDSPIGIQVIGQFGDDQLVLDVGELIERID